MNWSILGQVFTKSNHTQQILGQQKVPGVDRSVFDAPELGNWYHPVLLGPGTIGALASNPACLHEVIQIIDRLEPDDYIRYLLAYYRTGLDRFGDAWRYADIATVLQAAAQLIQPRRYLEVGVRRGRSMAIVAATCPTCDIVGFDLWSPNYAGAPNPGPEFVQAEMRKLGYTGRLELVTGNSHETLPDYFSQHPDTFFDLITVDGDHSRRGAAQDLHDVLPYLKIGGVIIFDDISHPQFPFLERVWRRAVGNPRYAQWSFTELGYGVGLAIRKY